MLEIIHEKIHDAGELLSELVKYNEGQTLDLSDTSMKALELLTRPLLAEDKYVYILGRLVYERVPLRGEDEVQVREIVEDTQTPDGIYRIPAVA